MAVALLPDRLWDLVEPFLPILPRRPQGGRPRVSDHACLTGIVFVLRSAIPWQMLPQELGCGSGMTCWRRLARLATGGRLGSDALCAAGLARTRPTRLIGRGRSWTVLPGRTASVRELCCLTRFLWRVRLHVDHGIVGCRVLCAGPTAKKPEAIADARLEHPRMGEESGVPKIIAPTVAVP
jgi:transposase